MAAFTEMRGQSMRSINDLLNMRNQRKQANADRLLQATQFGVGSVLSGREAEKDREAQLERIGATGEEQRATAAAKYEPFPDGPREIVDAATGRTVLAYTPAEFDVLSSQLQGFRGQEQMEFTDEQRQAAQADAIERMRLESRLNINELDAQEQSQIRIMEQELQNDQSMIDYERGKFENGMYQTQDGAVFTWSDPETYRAALDEIGQHTQKLAGISSRNPVVWEVYKDAVGRAKEQMWAPNYDENGMVIWERTDVTQETLMENFVAELPMTGMSEADRNNAIEAFRTYLINAEQSPPQEFSEADGSTTINNTTNVDPLIRPNQESVETTVGPTARGYINPTTEESEVVLGDNPTLARNLMRFFGLAPGEAIPFLQDDYYPEGITPAPTDFSGREMSTGSAEQRLYDRLMQLVEAGKASEADVKPFIQTLIDEEKETYPDIDAFLRRAGVGTGASGGF